MAQENFNFFVGLRISWKLVPYILELSLSVTTYKTLAKKNCENLFHCSKSKSLVHIPNSNVLWSLSIFYIQTTNVNLTYLTFLFVQMVLLYWSWFNWCSFIVCLSGVTLLFVWLLFLSCWFAGDALLFIWCHFIVFLCYFIGFYLETAMWPI